MVENRVVFSGSFSHSSLVINKWFAVGGFAVPSMLSGSWSIEFFYVFEDRQFYFTLGPVVKLQAYVFQYFASYCCRGLSFPNFLLRLLWHIFHMWVFKSSTCHIMVHCVHKLIWSFYGLMVKPHPINMSNSNFQHNKTAGSVLYSAYLSCSYNIGFTFWLCLVYFL